MYPNGISSKPVNATLDIFGISTHKRGVIRNEKQDLQEEQRQQCTGASNEFEIPILTELSEKM